MGSNKQALTLIIERLGDVHRAIDFAKEQSDDDLWEDLLKYSETRPSMSTYYFIFFLNQLLLIHYYYSNSFHSWFTGERRC